MTIREGMMWGLLLGFGLLVATFLWQLLTAPKSEGLTPVARAERKKRTVNGIQQGWLTLTGLPLTPADVRHLGWLAGAVAVVTLTLSTHNPLVGTAFGLVGLLVPEALVRYWARKQWQKLDLAAFGAAHMLQAKLQSGMPVLEAFRGLVPDASEPFKTWITPCMTGESKGIPLEDTLKQRAAPIQHVELGALADVLAAERQHGRTAPIVARAVDLWSQRMHADAVRRGTLAGSTMLGYGVVLLGIAAFWGIVIESTVVRHGLGHGLGFWTTGIGAWMIALAGYLQNRVSRQSEAV